MQHKHKHYMSHIPMRDDKDDARATHQSHICIMCSLISTAYQCSSQQHNTGGSTVPDFCKHCKAWKGMQAPLAAVLGSDQDHA